MSWLENHHLHLTLVFGLLIFSIAVMALYISWQAHNVTAMVTVVPATATALTGLHAGSSMVAASPNTSAYGSPPQPPIALPAPANPSPPAPPSHI